MSRKDVSLVSTFIGAVPWVTIRIQTKSGLEKRSLERSITIQATCLGKLRKRDRISSRQKNRTETKANRSTNGVLKVRLQVSSGIRHPSPTSRCGITTDLGRHWSYDNRTFRSLRGARHLCTGYGYETVREAAGWAPSPGLGRQPPADLSQAASGTATLWSHRRQAGSRRYPGPFQSTLFVSAPHSGVLGHPQPFVGHDKPMILVHDRAALLGLLTAHFRMISKLLRLGHRGHFL